MRRVGLEAWAVERIARVIDLPVQRALSSLEQALEAQVAAALIAHALRLKARCDADAARRRIICGAKTRKGTPCRCKSEPGKRRCKFHGGKSTGARTPEGIERIREAQRQRWAKWRAERLKNNQSGSRGTGR